MVPVILFDGDCNFCNRSVQFIIKHDPAKYFYFASLESEIGQEFLRVYSVSSDIDSIILIENGKAYVKSTATLLICRRLNRAWRWLYILIVIPSPIRNGIYDFLARNRYKWFGKKESCVIPSRETRKRFLS